jgi:phenylpropionate dioxygenase-like ring-hydroxylating dioxygenase large terminal subunit
MYINFWYPVFISSELTNNPVRVRIMKHDFVAFRDSKGKAAVLSDTCIHRGGSLAGGKCKEDGTVQCPYHGWRFNSDGICTRIPSLGIKAKIPARARVDAYPVQEKYGLVFAFLGDLPEAERPPIMPIDEENDPEWRSTVMSFDVAYHYERSIENGLDPAHNEYVHPTHGYSGEREEEYKVNELEPHRINTWGTGFMHTFDAPPLKNWLMKRFRPAGGKMQAGSGTVGPNHMWTFIHFSETKFMHQYMFEAPVEENLTRVFLVNFRNVGVTKYEFLNKFIDKKVNERNMVVASQDIVVVDKLRPVLTPSSRTKELLMPHDKSLLEYRDLLDSFEARGWKIDLQAVNDAHSRGDVIHAIPSPTRRTDKGWVLDPVPLVQAKQTIAQAAE